MSAKMGRPTLNPRNIQTRIRMNEQEAQMLKECAERLQKTKTDVVIMGIEKVYAELQK